LAVKLARGGTLILSESGWQQTGWLPAYVATGLHCSGALLARAVTTLTFCAVALEPCLKPTETASKQKKKTPDGKTTGVFKFQSKLN